MTPKQKKAGNRTILRTTLGNPEDRAHEIADELIGTCLDLHGVATDAEFDDGELMSQLDELAFECEGCGWWCHIEEQNEGMLCDDCFNADVDDDG